MARKRKGLAKKGLDYRAMGAHYDAKVPKIAERWKEVTPKKKTAFAEGVAKILGVSPADIKRADEWERGVTEATKYFEETIKGKGSKLAENYKLAMTTA